LRISGKHLRRAAAVWPGAAALLHPLVVALIVGALLRALLWGNLPRLGLISDEGEYLSAASWLAQGRSFAWYHGYLWTRAPLYPLFVAAHLRLFGDQLAPIFVTQSLLSLLNVALVYTLARQLTRSARGASGEQEPAAAGPLDAVPGIAALLTAIFFPFAVYAQVLLSETLFITLLLAAFWALTRLDGRPGAAHTAAGALRRFWPLAAAGVLLGLATLTRSLALGFVPIVALWLLLRPADRTGGLPARIRAGWKGALVFAVAAAVTIGPWTIYNSRQYGGLVAVDTSGAFNLLLGARTAYEGRREDAQVRNFVLGLLGQPVSEAGYSEPCVPHPGPLPTQAARQAAMMSEAVCLIAARPAAFVQKSLAELIDLFQINYTGAERFTSGFSSGRLPVWYVLGLFVLEDTLYVLVLPLAVLGWAHARRDAGGRRASPAALGSWSLASLVGLWWLYNLATAPLLFAINRFRLPLMPFALIFAAYALAAGLQLLARRRASAAQPSRPPARLHGPAGAGWMWATGALAGLLWLVAATPYAYLEPRAPDEPARWASYLGPYPSSLEITRLAIAARPRAEGDRRFAAALREDDFAGAAAALRSGQVSAEVARLGEALIAARAGRYADVLRLLPAETVDRARDARGAVLRGDALRSLGDEAAARATFTQRYVDDANPVDWAWEWLRPAPTRRIDLGGNLDLGYIAGCYLGEGDPVERTTWRWCTDGARLRFPAAGTGGAQELLLHADGRGWPIDMGPPPPVQVLAGGRVVGEFAPDAGGPRTFSVQIPAVAEGADVVITLRARTFVPGPERYLRQQSEESLGQVQRLGVRLDWVELRP